MPLLYPKNHQFFDSNGDPLASGTLTFYQTGTTTPISTYTTSAYSVANANPFTLNAAGRTTAQVWVRDLSLTRVILKDSGGSPISDDDPLDDILAPLTVIAVDDGSSADLRSTQGAVNGQIAVTRGYWSSGDYGAGMYWWDASSTATHNGGTVISVSGVATGRWKLIHHGQVSIRQFGAKGDGSADDTAEIQAAIDSGVRSVFIPNGTFLVTGTITATTALEIVGIGYQSNLVVDSAVGASTDIIVYDPPSGGSENRQFRLANFRISAESGTPGRDAILIDLDATSFASQLIIENLVVAQLGGHAVQLNKPSGDDGLFCSVIRDNLFHGGGLYFERIGDSVHIERNTITGTGVGIEMSQVTGAAQVIIRQNNITSAGGAMVLHAGNQTKILNNQIEQSAAYTGSDNACIFLEGDTAELLNCEIRGNNINAQDNVAYCITVANASVTTIDDNTLNGNSARKHISITNAADKTRIGGGNLFTVDGSATSARIDDSGAITIGSPVTVSSFSNSWVAYDAANSPVRYVRDLDGFVHLDGIVKDGTAVSGTEMFTLPAGFRPAVAGTEFPAAAFSGGSWVVGAVLIESGGAVKYRAGGNTLLSLAGIRFKVAL